MSLPKIDFKEKAPHFTAFIRPLAKDIFTKCLPRNIHTINKYFWRDSYKMRDLTDQQKYLVKKYGDQYIHDEDSEEESEEEDSITMFQNEKKNKQIRRFIKFKKKYRNLRKMFH